MDNSLDPYPSYSLTGIHSWSWSFSSSAFFTPFRSRQLDELQAFAIEELVISTMLSKTNMNLPDDVGPVEKKWTVPS